MTRHRGVLVEIFQTVNSNPKPEMEIDSAFVLQTLDTVNILSDELIK